MASVHTCMENRADESVRTFLNPLSRVAIFEYVVNLESCGR